MTGVSERKVDDHSLGLFVAQTPLMETGATVLYETISFVEDATLGDVPVLEDVDELVVAEAAGLHRAVRDGLVRSIAVSP